VVASASACHDGLGGDDCLSRLNGRADRSVAAVLTDLVTRTLVIGHGQKGVNRDRKSRLAHDQREEAFNLAHH
jgi:hypothetical protein